ncbi:MAG: NADH-quinone oxidoreductase subunit C [Thermodesulfobacteriota bacterium]
MSIAARAVTVAELIPRVESLRRQGYRFVTITCVAAAESGAELIYHFDRALALLHLRLMVDPGGAPPSIVPVYAAAWLVENEIQDQFGLRFAGLAPDYRRTLLLDGEDMAPPLRGDGREGG